MMMNPFTARLMAQLAFSRQQQQPYEPPDYEPFDPYEDEETKRRARNAGMAALLSGSLNSYLNRGRGAGDAFTAQREAAQGVRDRAVEQNRYAEAARLAREREERDRENDLLTRRMNEEKLTQAQREEQERITRRGAIAKSAPEIVARIEEVTGADSLETKRARSLAALGEDADLDRLDTLYAEVITRKRFPETERMKTDAEIEEIKRKVQAGVEEDPLAPGRRAERGLGMQARGLELEAERNRAYAESLGGGGKIKAPTPVQFQDDVRQERDKIMASEGKLRLVPDGKGGFKAAPPISAAEAEKKASQVVLDRYKALGVTVGAESGGGGATDASARLDAVTDPVIRKRIELARDADHSDEAIARFLGL